MDNLQLTAQKLRAHNAQRRQSILIKEKLAKHIYIYIYILFIVFIHSVSALAPYPSRKRASSISEVPPILQLKASVNTIMYFVPFYKKKLCETFFDVSACNQRNPCSYFEFELALELNTSLKKPPFTINKQHSG